MKIHTEGAITVCKIDKSDPDNKWNENVVLIISGHSSATVALEYITVNRLSYTARIECIRKDNDIFTWYHESNTLRIVRLDDPRKTASDKVRNSICNLAHKIITEATKNHPEVFHDADSRYNLATINNISQRKQKLLAEIQSLDNESAKSWHNILVRENEYAKLFHATKT